MLVHLQLLPFLYSAVTFSLFGEGGLLRAGAWHRRRRVVIPQIPPAKSSSGGSLCSCRSQSLEQPPSEGRGLWDEEAAHGAVAFLPPRRREVFLPSLAPSPLLETGGKGRREEVFSRLLVVGVMG